ncbi:MFS general substrate transporter [Rickenella mellea]|uniref:MFS general substrate transporter n=1 Tax=Rickenella mellea TaxID=50990 RepID=A0A4Y7PVV0_9AGAM|nr:MFS general substrate transporter [Rickenella mellea]
MGHDATIDSSEKGSIGDITFSGPLHLDFKNVDVAIGLATGHAEDEDLSPEESRRIRNKLDRHLLPLLFIIYCMLYIDKGALASSSILGILTDAHLTTDDFNTLGSAFSIGFLVFEYPQNLALQRFPVGKWLTFNVFLWCIFLGLHPVCHNFSSLFALRFFLGATEGSMMAGLMLVTSMYYTRTEIGERLGWTFQCFGFATIISGFLSFAVFHASPKAHPNQWQWLMIVITIMTFIVFVLFLFFFPDNPTTARFLTEEEKVKVVKRVQGNQNGIETKVWKKEQFMEALTDVKTWLFFFFATIANLQNGLQVQYSIIIKSFGFTTLQTTLLNIPSGFSSIIGVTLACYLLRRFPNSRAWINITFWIPSIVGALVQICLPFKHKVGHLIAIYITNFGGIPGFVMTMSWVASTSAGHTKRLTVNSIFIIGYALGQILCTQFWKEQYRPRNIVPWSINLATYFINITLILVTRYVFVTENKRRDALQAEAEASGKSLAAFDDMGYIGGVDENGKQVRIRVEKSMLDMTDKENLAFRYVL